MAHRQNQHISAGEGPRGGPDFAPRIDLKNTLFYECLTKLKVKDKSNS